MRVKNAVAAVMLSAVWVQAAAQETVRIDPEVRYQMFGGVAKG